MLKIDWKKLAAIIISVAGILLAIYLVCKVLLSLFLPFLLALALSLVTRPLVLRLHRRLGWPIALCAVLVTLGALALLVLFLFFICNRLILEAQTLLDYLIADSENPDGEIAAMLGFLRELLHKLPFVSRLGELHLFGDALADPEQYFITQLQAYFRTLAGDVAGGITAVLRRLPGIAFFLLVSVISCFYFAIEYEAVKDGIYRVLPKSIAARLPEWRVRAMRAAKRYLRAYFFLFLITLTELALGLFLLGIAYPFLLAFLIAFLDILPVLGVGTVLLPWGFFSFATGRVGRGIGILVLYLVITVIRQVAEPHLVGKSLGMHPILVLVSFYAGLRLFGFAGLLLGPALALLAKGILEYHKSDQGI